MGMRFLDHPMLLRATERPHTNIAVKRQCQPHNVAVIQPKIITSALHKFISFVCFVTEFMVVYCLFHLLGCFNKHACCYVVD